METKSDMKNMTIWNIARACKGHLAVPAGKHTGTCPAAGMAVIRGYSGKEAAGIVIDSRKVEPGDILWQSAENGWMVISLSGKF